MIPVLHLGPVALPTYYLIISAVVSFCIYWSVLRARQQNFSHSLTLNIDLLIMISGFLGARAFHVFYENFDYYVKYPYGVFYIWQGGFVYYGGAIAAFVATLIYCRINKLEFLKWTDFYAPIMSLGYGLGRVACFLNGCCYGRVCDLNGSRYPTQLMAFGLEMLILIALLSLEKKRFFKAYGQLFFLWVSLHSVARIVMEFYRDDERGATLLSLSISSWISLVLWGSSLAAVWVLQGRKRQTF